MSFLKFFERYGWWNGEAISYASKHYRVIYEDEGVKMLSEMEIAVLSPELARIEIGCQVAVRWPNNGRFYEGTVSRERNTERPFSIVYDAGGHEWVDFRKRRFKFLGCDAELAGDSSSKNVASLLLKLFKRKYAIGTKVEKGEEFRVYLDSTNVCFFLLMTFFCFGVSSLMSLAGTAEKS
jgi:hypothetical protein